MISIRQALALLLVFLLSQVALASRNCASIMGRDLGCDHTTSECLAQMADIPAVEKPPGCENFLATTPPKKIPDKQLPKSDPNSQEDALAKAAAEAEQKRLEAARQAEEARLREEQARRLREKEIAAQRQAELDRERSGQPRSPGDKNLLDLAGKSHEKDGNFPRSVADKADDPDLRDSLKFISGLTDLKQEYKRDYTQLLATIAQLSQMTLTNQQRVTNMGSAVDPASQNGSGISNKSPAATRSAKSAKLGEEKSAITAQGSATDLNTETDGSDLSAEDKAKLKTAIDAAQKRKDLLALKKKLKDKLKTGADRKLAEAEEATKSFNGDLIPDQPQRSLASADPEKEKEEFLNSAVFHAMQAQFSMDGGQTRAEVQRMLDEVEKELGVTGDILAGILGTNTKSLFERVREAHQQCLRAQCVFLVHR